MGVRVLAGDQSGYAYVEGVTLEEMLRAARTAAVLLLPVRLESLSHLRRRRLKEIVTL